MTSEMQRNHDAFKKMLEEAGALRLLVQARGLSKGAVSGSIAGGAELPHAREA